VGVGVGEGRKHPLSGL